MCAFAEYSEGESLFYIISPRDVVVAKERDQDDHIDWLLEKKKYEVINATVFPSGFPDLEIGVGWWTSLGHLDWVVSVSIVIDQMLVKGRSWLYISLESLSSYWNNSSELHPSEVAELDALSIRCKMY